MELYRYDPKDQPGAVGLNDFLQVAIQMERWQSIRAGIAEFLVWLGVLLWLMAGHPGLLPHGLDRVVIGLWGAVAVFFVYAVVKEWTWRRRKQRYRVLEIERD